MADRTDQSFALVLEEANGGRPHKDITRRWNEMVDKVTTRASENEQEWSGTMTVKVKFTVDTSGQVDLKFNCTTTAEEPDLVGARLWYNPDTGALENTPPRVQLDKQITIPGAGYVKPAKSAAAPKE